MLLLERAASKQQTHSFIKIELQAALSLCCVHRAFVASWKGTKNQINNSVLQLLRLKCVRVQMQSRLWLITLRWCQLF